MDKGIHDPGNEIYRAYAEQAKALCLLKSNPLWHKLTKNQIKIGQKNGNKHSCCRLAVGHIPLAHFYCQYLSNTGSRRRTGKEACQSDRDLDRRKKDRRVLHQTFDQSSVFIALLRQTVDFVFVDRDHSHLRA